MKKLIKERPLLSFFILAYALSWIVWVPLIFAKGMEQDLISLIMLVGVLGPMGAGIIISRITGTSKIFWKSTLKWKVPFRWYIISLGIPLLVLFILLGINYLWGVSAETVGELPAAHTNPWYNFPLVLLFMMLFGGGMEEPGWRGYAQSRMLALFTPFVASLILGVIWTYWHAPLFFVPGSSQQGIELGWYTAGVTGLAVILTWIFIRSEGSAWLAILFHGSANAINDWVPSFKLPVAGIEFTDFAVMEFIYIIIALVIIVFNREMFFHKNKSSNALVVFREWTEIDN